jgi:GNAT superfamily N-acetyltransferase
MVGLDQDRWASTVVLGDGDTALIRPITPADRVALAAFHQRQSSESIYRRYFSAKPSLSESELTHFTELDFVNRVALVVERHGHFIAWASYERWPNRADAEAAFMVDDNQQGLGIATLLLEHLAAIARSNGITRFTAEVLAENRPMMVVFTRAGWPVERHFDSGVIDVEFSLDNTAAFIDSVERREQRADSRAIARLLLPRSIALIGASDRPGNIGTEIWENLRTGFGGPLLQ